MHGYFDCRFKPVGASVTPRVRGERRGVARDPSRAVFPRVGTVVFTADRAAPLVPRVAAAAGLRSSAGRAATDGRTETGPRAQLLMPRLNRARELWLRRTRDEGHLRIT